LLRYLPLRRIPLRLRIRLLGRAVVAGLRFQRLRIRVLVSNVNIVCFVGIVPVVRAELRRQPVGRVVVLTIIRHC
jgi:hypothetical protein